MLKTITIDTDTHVMVPVELLKKARLCIEDYIEGAPSDGTDEKCMDDIAAILAAPQPEQAQQSDIDEALRDAIADVLGNAYDCMRVWSAWNVGTMSRNDFVRVADDDCRLQEFVDAVKEVYDRQQISQNQQSGLVAALEAKIARIASAVDGVRNLKQATHTKQGATLEEQRMAWMVLNEALKSDPQRTESPK